MACYKNNFSTLAIDNIYCGLPERAADDYAKIYPVSYSNHATVLATNKQNAIDKNWKVLYIPYDTELVTMGTYVCGTGID